MSIRIGTRVVNGIDVEIIVSPKNGTFTLHPPIPEGEARAPWTASGETLDKAVQAARVEINKRKVKVELPFRTLNGGRGVATGIHGGTGKIMAKMTTRAGYTSNDQLDGYAKVLRADTPDEVIDKIEHLRREANRLTREAEKLQGEYQISLGRELRELVDAKAAEATREEATA